MTIKEYRMKYKVSVKDASIVSGVPLRTYIRYETDDNYGNELKRKQIIMSLKEKYEINEDKGILCINDIKEIVAKILSNYDKDISFCYLFGSYSKGYAKDNSDIDLCISTSLTGVAFVGLIEELREALNKRIDLLRTNDLKDNIELVEEIMKSGIKIYG